MRSAQAPSILRERNGAGVYTFLPPPRYRKVMRMRKTVLLLASMALTVLLTSGVAAAITLVRCDGGICRGTQGVDRIEGTQRVDEIYAYSSDDEITGGDGTDRIYGGSGQDDILGDYSATGSNGAGDDRIFGGDGGDWIWGGGGSNLIVGEEGNDFLNAITYPDDVPGRSTVKGGPGNDDIFADDGLRDIISCGSGTEDEATFDKGLDSVDNCETRTPR